MKTTRLARVSIGVAAAALAVTSLAACSSGSGSSSSSSSAAASSSAIGGNVLPPVMVEPGATTATAKVGDTLVFKVEGDPANSKIATDNDAVLEVKQGSNDGSAQFNPGAKALKAGKATVTVTDAAGKVQTVAVTVE